MQVYVCYCEKTRNPHLKSRILSGRVLSHTFSRLEKTQHLHSGARTMNDSTNKEDKSALAGPPTQKATERAESTPNKEVDENEVEIEASAPNNTDEAADHSEKIYPYAAAEEEETCIPRIVQIIGAYDGEDKNRTLEEKLYDCNFDWDKFEDNASSESIPSSDEWQDLTKSDYAKVIFCDLFHHADSGSVECKFQITDNVHEDPCDYVGLFRVGYDNLSQCLISKMLSETECEEDGKLLRCVFAAEELPDIQDGYYQFLYVTRDKEICGASMPFEIKQRRQRSLDDDVVTEKADDDFVLVRTGLEKKNQLLEELLAETQEKNRQLNSTIQTLMDEKEHDAKEKEIIIDSLHQEILASKGEIATKASAIAERDKTMSTLSGKIASLSHEISAKDSTIREKDNSICQKNQQIENEVKKQTQLKREKQSLATQVRILESTIKERDIALSSIDQDKVTLVEQLEDQKFMIKALEDSKQLALKEMNDLSESLSKRTKILNQTRSELASCKEAFQECTKSLDECTKVLSERESELTSYKKKLLESSKALDERTEELNKVKSELLANQAKLEQSVKTVEQCTEVLDNIKKKTSPKERSFSSSSLTTTNVLRKALNEKRCEMLACRGKISDVTALLKQVSQKIQSEPEEIVISCTRERLLKTEKKYLKELDKTCFHSLRTVETKDIKYVNKLTEKIKKREPGTLFQIESFPVSEIPNECLRKDMLRLDRIMNAVKDHLSKTNDWSSLIDGYNMEYSELPVELQIQVILAECRREYQIEILLDFLSKSHQAFSEELYDQQIKTRDWEKLLIEMRRKVCEDAVKRITEKENKITDLSNELHDLQCKNKDLKIEVCDLKTKYEEALSSLTEKDNKITELSEDLVKKQTVIENTTDEKDSLVQKHTILQETVNEHTARIMEAAEIYKKQFLEIEKLKKKLMKAKLRSPKMSSVSSEEIPEVISEDDSKSLPLTTEKLRPLRNSSDSDTGEHVLTNNAVHQPLVRTCVETSIADEPNYLLPLKGAVVTSCLPNVPIAVIDEKHTCASSFVEPLANTVIFGNWCIQPEVKNQQGKCCLPTAVNTSLSRSEQQKVLEQQPPSTNASEASKSSMSDQESWQKFISEKLGSIKDTSLPENSTQDSPNEEFFTIPCLLCDKSFMISSKSTSPLLDHLEQHHQLNMCPICGQLFEASFPKIFIMYHINDHFKSK